MNLYLIHMDAGLKDVLDRVMPHAQWSYPEPKFIKKHTLGSVGATMRGRILAALREIPNEVTKLSSRTLKESMGLEGGEDIKSAFTRAMASLDLTQHGWKLEGRSIVRGATAYGF